MSNAQKVSDERLEAIANQLEEWGEAYSGHVSDTLTALRELQSLRAAPTPDAHSEVGVTEAMKEWVLLEIIAAMGGQTDAGDERWHWLQWFCGADKAQTDTFNRCIDKGWLNSSHDSDTDHSVAWITDLGRATLTAGAVKAEPVAITDEMVERAYAEFMADKGSGPDGRTTRQTLRDTLYAALASKPEGER